MGKPRTPRTGQDGYITPLNVRQQPEAIGNKAASLHKLLRQKFPVPLTYVCNWHAYGEHFSQPEAVASRLRAELGQIIQPGKSYAVRSSANIEDSLTCSFAGQFTTILNVSGVDQVLEAIVCIWQDAQKESVQAYIQKIHQDSEELMMAVIIQEMVQPYLSGVVFSKNPITTMDEVIVEAVHGLGTALVQDGSTPLRWVNKWGNWVQTPGSNQAGESSPDLKIIQQVVGETRKIVKRFRQEVDLEWVYDGQKLFWLQMRDITSIQNVSFFSNRMAKEMTPGLIKPLVWSVSIPNPSRSWVKLLTELIGKNTLDPQKLLRLIHYRVYFNMAEFGKVFAGLGLPRESLEMMLGLLPKGAGKPPMKPSLRIFGKLPRLLGFLWDKWRFLGRLKADYPALYERAYQFRIEFKPGSDSDEWLIAQIDRIQLLNQDLSFLTIITILMMQTYTALFRRKLQKMGIDFLQFDLKEGMNEFIHYDPGSHLKVLHERYCQLPENIQQIFRMGDYAEFMKTSNIDDLQSQVQDFLGIFGHMSDTTAHFSNPAWRENPGLVLELIANHQTTAAESASARVKFSDLPRKSNRLRQLFRRTQAYHLWREKISSLFSYSVMLFRAYYLAIGANWVQKNLIQEAADILYLFDDEVRGLINGQLDWGGIAGQVASRKAEMEACRDTLLPEVIMGDDVPAMVEAFGDRLSGTPTSKGYYSGPARVVRGIGDFHLVQAGDVIVIPFSDVSWTPLFAKAGAVIAETGGMLSHSSIIAREYNIPAVVSVPGAMNIQNGTRVSIDGFAGEILVHQTLPLAVDLVKQEDQILGD